jgi:hypothetical protein
MFNTADESMDLDIAEGTEFLLFSDVHLDKPKVSQVTESLLSKTINLS